MPSIRTFVALSASAEIQSQMSDIQSRLITTRADVKWEKEDKFHITLKFLGNTGTEIIEHLSEKLSELIKTTAAFDIEYDTLGAFPDSNHPRVIWIGSKYNKSIIDLQSGAEKICRDFGFPAEERAFHPHITLGRVRGTRNIARLTEAIKTITFESIKTRCSELLLMKSDLRPSGSIYTILKSFPFQP
ncbi:MAG: RNA 2',3'-cyclic phosphodiesterase [Bacteroidetes bacterium]|nr:RNA 2',3'-cyclic phosphodiesterase [Bacteroidota bacterium]